jgi:cytochrome P450
MGFSAIRFYFRFLESRGSILTSYFPNQTPISMSSSLIHTNAHIFPSPLEFRPERWLDNKGLEKYLVSFSKGSRQCVGVNLAYAELYLCLNAVFGRYGTKEQKALRRMELFETTKEDVEMKHDLFIPGPRKESKGVRVVLG